jgi:hypothetical protein
MTIYHQYIKIEDNTTRYRTEDMEAFMNWSVHTYLAYIEFLNRKLPSWIAVPKTSDTPVKVSVFEYPSGNTDLPIKMDENRTVFRSRVSVVEPGVMLGSTPMAQLVGFIAECPSISNAMRESLFMRSMHVVGLTSRWVRNVNPMGVPNVFEWAQDQGRGFEMPKITWADTKVTTTKEAKVIKKKSDLAARCVRVANQLGWGSTSLNEAACMFTNEVHRMVKIRSEMATYEVPVPESMERAREHALERVREIKAVCEQWESKLKSLEAL